MEDQMLTIPDDNTDKFNIPSKFLLTLNELPDNEWFVLTDDFIKAIGFKSSVSNPLANRSNLFSCVRKKFIKDEEYRIKDVKVNKHGRGGAWYKNNLEMTKSAYTRLLQITSELRINKKKERIILYMCCIIQCSYTMVLTFTKLGILETQMPE